MSALAEPPTPKITDGVSDNKDNPAGPQPGSHGADIKVPQDNYKAFVAGIASGVAKLSGKNRPLSIVP